MCKDLLISVGVKQWARVALLIVSFVLAGASKPCAAQFENSLLGEPAEIKLDGQWVPAFIPRPDANAKLIAALHVVSDEETRLVDVPAADVRRPEAQSLRQFPTPVDYSNQPTRQWSGPNGNALFEGTLVRRHVDRILLATDTTNRSSGRTFKLRDLSAADRDYVLEQQAGSSLGKPKPLQFAKSPVSLKSSGWKFESKPASRSSSVVVENFRLVSPDNPATNRSAGPASPPSRPSGRAGGRGRAGRFGGSPRPNRGGVPNDGSADEDSSSASPVTISNPRFRTASLSGDGSAIVVAFSDFMSEAGYLQSTRLGNGSVKKSTSPGFPLAVNMDGESVALLFGNQTSAATGRYDKLEVICLKAGNYWEAPGAALGKRAPKHAVFANEDLLVMVGSRLTVVSLPQGRAYQSDDIVPELTSLAASPDQQHVALGIKDGALIFNAARGRNVGFLSLKEAGDCQVAFSPDGQRVAIAGEETGRVGVFDLRSGEEEAEFTVGTVFQPALAWTSENLLYFGNRVIDLDSKATVWEYVIAGGELAHLGGEQFLYLNDNQAKLLRLPHLDLAAKLRGLDLEAATVLKRGDSVSIKLDSSLNAFSGLSSLQKGLVDQLAERGITVSANAAKVLELSVETLPSESIEVGDLNNRSAAPKTVSFTPTVSRMRLTEGGKKLWTHERFNRPSRALRGQRGESLEQAASRYARPDVSSFSLPFGDRLISLADGEGIPGKSVIGPAGITEPR